MKMYLITISNCVYNEIICTYVYPKLYVTLKSSLDNNICMTLCSTYAALSSVPATLVHRCPIHTKCLCWKKSTRTLLRLRISLSLDFFFLIARFSALLIFDSSSESLAVGFASYCRAVSHQPSDV
jgi:hypothetical protein